MSPVRSVGPTPISRGLASGAQEASASSAAVPAAPSQSNEPTRDTYALATRAAEIPAAAPPPEAEARSLQHGPLGAYLQARAAVSSSPPLLPGVVAEMAQVHEAAQTRPGSDPDVAAAISRLTPMTWALPAPPALPEGQQTAGGRYLVDGVPKVANQLLRGDVAEARQDGMIWFLLGQNRGEWVQYFQNLFDFSTSVEMNRPKAVFHATARQFEVGQELGVYLSTTESPAFAAKYVPHASEERRVVTFVLDGSPNAPALAGLIRIDGWNEVMLPPDAYKVSAVEKTAFGEVVTLQPTTTPRDQLRSALHARMEDVVPDTVEDF